MYKLKTTNLPRAIITIFFLIIFAAAMFLKMPFGVLISDILIRFGMNGILVLAMVPSIKTGLGPNFALPIGIVAGLIGSLISLELSLVGFWAFLVAIIISTPIAILFGVLYGIMLNRIKGSEMIVATYTGFSIVSLFSVFWIVAPFKNRALTWPLGVGLRNIISLEKSFGRILNDFLSLKIIEKSNGESIFLFNKTAEELRIAYGNEFNLNFNFPTGLLIIFAIACLIMYIFIQSKSGYSLKTTGDNPNFARSSGINVDKNRIIGITLSTVLASIGIVVYSQSYGNLQLYQSPLMMAFPAVASVLIGGASAKRVSISHVIIGTFLFNGILTIALPVANELLPEGNLSEILRMIIQNGVILYALTKVGGSNGK